MSPSTDSDSILYGLRKLAGVDRETYRFRILSNGCIVIVQVNTDNDGYVSSVHLNIVYDEAGSLASTTSISAIRPLLIELHRTTPNERSARENGLVQTWSSGDKDFDEAIYIDSPTVNPDVFLAVLNPQVRACAYELLKQDVDTLWIDDEENVLKAWISYSLLCKTGSNGLRRAEGLIHALTSLRAHLPAVISLDGQHPAPPLNSLVRGLRMIGNIGWVLNVSLVGIIAMINEGLGGPDLSNSPIDIWMLLGAGLLVGIFTSIALGNAVLSRAQGHPSAPRLGGEARIAGFLGASVLTFFTGIMLVIAWLSFSTP